MSTIRLDDLSVNELLELARAAEREAERARADPIRTANPNAIGTPRDALVQRLAAKALKGYLAKGYTYQDIANLFGTSRQRVSQVANRLGVTTPRVAEQIEAI